MTGGCVAKCHIRSLSNSAGRLKGKTDGRGNMNGGGSEGHKIWPGCCMILTFTCENGDAPNLI